MGDLREVYKRVGENDWVLVEMKDLKVGDLFSLHEDGKFLGIFKGTGPPYVNKEGAWTVNVSKYCEGV